VVEQLGALEHVRVLRIHTRVPFVDPERVSEELLTAIQAFPRVTYAALHVNHADEFTPEAMAAITRLRKRGVILLSQSVLLRGVNDTAAALSALFRRCVEEGIKPYYLHHPDLAPGTAHFRSSIAEGQRLMQELRGNTSGICLPHYVLDIPGGFGKVPIGPQYLHCVGERYCVSDPAGVEHQYPPSAD
jgi:lysine 2,3-aminomutase